MKHIVNRNIGDHPFLWMGKDSFDFISGSIGRAGLLVYLCLCYYANTHDQTCYPSITTLAAKSRLGREKITRAIKALEAAELIAVYRKHGLPNQYRLLRCDPHPVDKLISLLCSSTQVSTGGSTHLERVPVLGEYTK